MQGREEEKQGEAVRREDLRVHGLPSVHSRAAMKALQEEEERLNMGVPKDEPNQPERWGQRADEHWASSWGNIRCKHCNTRHSGSAAFADHLNGKKHKNKMLEIAAAERQQRRLNMG